MAVTALSYAILDKDEAAAYLKIATPTGNTLDVLQIIINAVTDLIEEVIGGPVVAREFTDVLDGDDAESGALMLPRTPVVSVTSLLRLNEDGSTAYSYASGSYWLKPNTGEVVMKSGYAVWPGTQNYSVTYQAGFSTVPSDIELVARQVLRLAYRRFDKGDDGVESVTVEGQSTRFDRSAYRERIRKELAHRRKPWGVA